MLATISDNRIEGGNERIICMNKKDNMILKALQYTNDTDLLKIEAMPCSSSAS